LPTFAVYGSMTNVIRTSFIAFLAVACVVTGCEGVGSGPAVRGSGVVASESRDVSGFSQVRVEGSGDVVIDQTGTESVSVEAEDNILPLLETRVSNGVLHLGTKANVNIHPTKPLRFHVTVKNLTGVGISGSGSARASALDTDKLTADISGSGSATLAGRADDVVLRVSGSGSYDASKLQSRNVRVDISGSGDAVVNASDHLDANISGSGSVHYTGKPQVTQHVSGSGSIASR
jgi:hypothetical protein